MRILRKIIFIIAIALLAVSCAKEQINEFTPNGGNVVKFSVESSSNREVSGSTRAGSDAVVPGENNDITIHYGYIFYFNNSGKLIGHYYLDKDVDVISNNGTTNPSFKIDDGKYNNSYKIICVFNYDKANYNSDFSDITKDNVSSKFPMDSEFLNSVESSHNGDATYIEGGGERYDVGMPMFVNDFTDVNTSTHEIYKCIARISIAATSNLTIPHESHQHQVLLEDLSYTIVNRELAGQMGFTTLSNINAVTSSNNQIYNGEDELTFPYAINKYVEGDDHTTLPKVYLYEFPYSTRAIDGTELDSETYDSKRLSVIIAHKDSYTKNTLYYKLNLVDKIENKYFDVERNHCYRVVIKSIYSRGYASLKEAYLMPPSNIEYEIYDDKGELTYSNGQYAISMDEVLNYDEIQVYGHDTTLIAFNNIRYIIPNQMNGVDLNELTNSVEFEILTIDDSEGLTVSTDKNEFKDNPHLTADGRSIVLKLTGSGSCTFKLKIKLGNLELGRETITIRKEAKDGALDAHPCQIKYKNIKIDESSWQSSDLDFGAWFRAEDNTSIIYLGDNSIPTGYQTMDGYISSSSAKDSYPIFSEKIRTAYYSYTEVKEPTDPDYGEEEIKKSKIMVVQLPPAYLGHFGDLAPDGSTTHYNGIIAERIEEIKRPSSSWMGESDFDGAMPWATADKTYYSPSLIYDNTTKKYKNLVEGLAITKYIVENNTSSTQFPSAAHYCYYKNDINGNGVIDSNEPIVWYLPAQNQMLAMWINKTALQVDPRYDLNGGTGHEYIYYWTCSEYNAYNQDPGTMFPHAISTNIIEGETFSGAKGAWQQAHVRCVRAVNH